MRCENCGAAADENTDVCEECGASVRPVAVEPVSSTVGVDTLTDPGERHKQYSGPVSGRPSWLIPLVAVVVLAIIAGAAYFMFGRVGALGNGPDDAAVRMMTAFAEYDADGILDNATHASMTATDVAAFERQAADAKKQANGKPGLKDLKVVKTTIDPKKPNEATVQLSAQWLTDPAKGTYAKRTETLTLVKQKGKWLVRLFQ